MKCVKYERVVFFNSNFDFFFRLQCSYDCPLGINGASAECVFKKRYSCLCDYVNLCRFKTDVRAVRYDQKFEHFYLMNTDGYVSFSDRLLSVIYPPVCTIFTFLSSSRSVSTQTGTKHSYVKVIELCWNEWPCLFPTRYNDEIALIHWRNLNIFCRNTGPISNNRCWKHLWLKVCSNEAPPPLSKGR